MKKWMDLQIAGIQVPVYRCHLLSAHGCLDWDEHGSPVVKISDSLPMDKARATLAHEIHHVVYALTGWSEVMANPANREEAMALLHEWLVFPALEKMNEKATKKARPRNRP